MFLIEKYCPKSIRDLTYHHDIVDRLFHATMYENVPHIIISGPPGGSKKLLIDFYLHSIYGNDVKNVQKVQYTIQSSKKKIVEIEQSPYHAIIIPTNTNRDKYILHDVIHTFSNVYLLNTIHFERKLKTIVIYNIENLSSGSQSALRRTMENYAHQCRFIMTCNNLSAIFDPLKSRCTLFYVPLPSRQNMCDTLMNIVWRENLALTRSDCMQIIDQCEGRIEDAIYLLNNKILKIPSASSFNEAFDYILNVIMNIHTINNFVRIFYRNIRPYIYDMLIMNIHGSEIILTLMNKMIARLNDDHLIQSVIQAASLAEMNLVQGRREIENIDYFICHLMKMMNEHYESLPIMH